MLKGLIYGVIIAAIGALAVSSVSLVVVIPAVVVLGGAAAIVLGGWHRSWPRHRA